MCGIGGYSLTREGNINGLGLLENILVVQKHRGPDAQGIWEKPEVRVGLCHSRLSIVDLSNNANQPMHTLDNSLSIVFNGEIYNWRLLRKQLELKGYFFVTNSDTEVLLHGYKEYGVELPNHIQGMFSFAIYDHKMKIIFCARDHIGKKPFIYTQTKHGIIFASEIPSLVNIPGCDTSKNHSAIASMLLHNMRHIPDPHTAYNGIKRLRAGHALIVKEGKIDKLWRYWQPEAMTGDITVDRLRNTLEEAVTCRMEADVPVAAMLSGGVDSSAIVHLMKKMGRGNVKTYALGMNKDDEDLRRAREMAKYLGCEHKEYYFNPETQYANFKKVIGTYGEPIMLLPLIHTYELCQNIRNDGIKVVLTGHGADELFYGYLGHQKTAWLSDALRVAESLAPLTALLPNKYIQGPLALLKAPKGKRKAAMYRSLENNAWGNIISQDAKHSIVNLAAEELEYWGDISHSKYYIDESNFCGLMVENTHSVTTASDLPAMMASVEMRAPFLDQNIISLALATHYRDKVHRTDPTKLKWILKKAVEDLMPAELLYAPKRGFGNGIQEKDVLLGPWRKNAEAAFADIDDIDGLFDTSAIQNKWSEFSAGGDADESLIAKIFSTQIWAKNA